MKTSKEIEAHKERLLKSIMRKAKLRVTKANYKRISVILTESDGEQYILDMGMESELFLVQFEVIGNELVYKSYFL